MGESPCKAIIITRPGLTFRISGPGLLYAASPCEGSATLRVGNCTLEAYHGPRRFTASGAFTWAAESLFIVQEVV
jgi:hypothetical protein